MTPLPAQSQIELAPARAPHSFPSLPPTFTCSALAHLLEFIDSANLPSYNTTQLDFIQQQATLGRQLSLLSTRRSTRNQQTITMSTQENLAAVLHGAKDLRLVSWPPPSPSPLAHRPLPSADQAPHLCARSW
jgi:hypothetical protein